MLMNYFYKIQSCRQVFKSIWNSEVEAYMLLSNCLKKNQTASIHIAQKAYLRLEAEPLQKIVLDLGRP